MSRESRFAGDPANRDMNVEGAPLPGWRKISGSLRCAHHICLKEIQTSFMRRNTGKGRSDHIDPRAVQRFHHAPSAGGNRRSPVAGVSVPVRRPAVVAAGKITNEKTRGIE